MNFRENKKKQGSFSGNLSTSFKDFIDPDKDGIICSEISRGIGNKTAFLKFTDFTWPLWLSEAEDFYSLNYRSSPSPVLLNTNFREWQSFTNYLSRDEIHIDRSGMITGPGGSPWSVEFWYMDDNTVYRPQKNFQDITPSRNHKTGEVTIGGRYGKTVFRERIAGGKSDIDEAIVTYEINTDGAGGRLFVVIRPYNCYSIGGVKSISYDSGSNLLKIENRAGVAFERKPDIVTAGSGDNGDIDCFHGEHSMEVECRYGMAALAAGFNLNKGSNTVNVRISLDSSKSLSPEKIDFSRSFREFRSFSELRLSEGLKLELPDEKVMEYFQQSKITLFNNNAGDFNHEIAGGYRNLYFFSFAMNRAGLETEAEKLVSRQLEKFRFNLKKPDYNSAICGAYLLNAFYECYIHKREPEYLQQFFPAIRKLGDYIYSFSTEIHSVNQLPGNTLNDRFIKEPAETDFVIFLSAMMNISYLARCMGIFGDELKFKNEADRIQSIIKNILDKRRSVSCGNFLPFYPLIALPDNVFSGYREEDYREFYSSLAEDKNFPLHEKLAGVDLFTSGLALIHLISHKDLRFKVFYEKFFSYIDDFFILPEFIDPLLKRGVWGDGNLKIIASLILVIIRNRIFLDRTDRLEIFTFPEKSWFDPGRKIKVENALTRYGRISFMSEAGENEIKLTFTGLPKFIPSDIMINIPVESSIIETDDFILKKKVGDSYIINGWPSVIRFTLPVKNAPGIPAA